MLMWKVESGEVWVVRGEMWRGSIGGGWEWLGWGFRRVSREEM